MRSWEFAGVCGGRGEGRYLTVSLFFSFFLALEDGKQKSSKAKETQFFIFTK